MYKNNESFFENWSESMAYILGFAMSDGCIDDKNGHSMLCWNIHKSDVCVLEYIRDKVSPNRHICYKNKADSVFLGITSRKIVDDVAKYHLIPNKTGKEKLCNIPDIYKSHFLRGLFDGDGNICCYERIRKSGKRTGKIRKDFEFRIFCLSKTFLEDVKKELCFNFGSVNWAGTCYVLRISKKEDIEKIYNFIYKNAEFFLKRKHDVFLKIPKTKKYTAFGEEKSKKEWLKDSRCVVNTQLLKSRLSQGKSFEYAISTPKIKGKEC